MQKIIDKQKLIARPAASSRVGVRISGGTSQEEIDYLISGQSTQNQLGKIKVYTGGKSTLGELIELFQDMRNAYNKVDFFLASDPNKSVVLDALVSNTVPELLAARDLVLIHASVHSPGVWEFLGSLNPLKVLCDYIQQRHERKKDNKYRNRAEEERLSLEVAILKNQVVKEKIGLLKSVGFSDIDIRHLLLSYINEPLALLERHVDTMFVEGSELVFLDKTKMAQKKTTTSKRKKV